MYASNAGYAKTYCAKSDNWYNVHISNEQCQGEAIQRPVLAQRDLYR